MKSKHLGIHVEQELHAKLKFIARYEGRSMNGQVIYLVQKCIREFEETNELITVNDLKQLKSFCGT